MQKKFHFETEREQKRREEYNLSFVDIIYITACEMISMCCAGVMHSASAAFVRTIIRTDGHTRVGSCQEEPTGTAVHVCVGRQTQTKSQWKQQEQGE